MGNLARGLEMAAASSKDEPQEELEQPASMSEDGSSLFLDKELFPDGCEEGSVVNIKATVKGLGTKIEVVPDEVTKVEVEGAGEQAEEQNQGY